MMSIPSVCFFIDHEIPISMNKNITVHCCFSSRLRLFFAMADLDRNLFQNSELSVVG